MLVVIIWSHTWQVIIWSHTWQIIWLVNAWGKQENLPGFQLFCRQFFQHSLTFFDDPASYAYSYRMLGKCNWFCLTGVIALVLLIWKWMGLFLKKNDLLQCWGWLSLLNWIWALQWSLLLKLPLRKLEPWFVLWSFFLLRLLCISITLPYSHVWNANVMSVLVLLVPNWNCWIN